MKIFIGADHNGFHTKNRLVNYLRLAGYDVVDDGDTTFQQDDDFPVFAHKVVMDMKRNDIHESRGILICGSGQGMCMAANRFNGIRACLGYNVQSVKSSRNDDDSNVLCIPVDSVKENDINVLVETWLHTPFASAPRFIRRIKEIDTLNV